ncbi:hypothetical protein PHPALM_28737 [Phytophthora palmivora]|uniref:Uncharacterized protein n=1 Tax=Phytophthora palmivora TaxID=4796 RepID=A0A2P4X9B0_9STRA|nr:hypothetical protein PHPALM_28737 [Phytophthora palmivora]
MVGNKHKNGIICTFPNCNKPMRTQKFKMHFTKAHLKDGEVYSVDHRRQYEVAREENALKQELTPAVVAVSTMMSSSTTREEIRTDTEATQGRQQTAVQSKRSNAPVDRGEDGTVTTNAPLSSIQMASMASTSAQTLLSSEQTSGRKRPASSMEMSVDPVDPTSVLLMQFIALMDQRFQELVGKMSEMIDVQKDLIDTLQATNPNGEAPASAFSHAVEMVMKRRRKDTSPRSKNTSDNSDGKDNAVAHDEDQDNGFAI